jgi:hypothetical protein
MSVLALLLLLQQSLICVFNLQIHDYFPIVLVSRSLVLLIYYIITIIVIIVFFENFLSQYRSCVYIKFFIHVTSKFAV